MESYIAEWLNLTLRWIHLITGAAWIGTSFYFNWLNHSLRPPESERRQQEGISGELFAVHGGHFYQVSKYAGAPAQLPETLHWFKWEAYFTWITGVCLLSVVYYFGARVFLIDPSVMAWEQTWQPIALSLGCLVGGWLVYDLLCKSPLGKMPVPFAALGFSLMTLAAYGLTEVFAARAAYIHVGAMIGTMMAANVFFVIIPNQRKMVDAMLSGQAPDISLGDQGAQRSLHNNYFTLPVLFIMVSNHFPMTYGHSAGWVILAALSLIGAGTRHYFNLKHKGHHSVWILPVAALAMVALAFVAKPPPPPLPSLTAVGAERPKAETYAVQHIIEKHCVSCHQAHPKNRLWPMPTPPKGVDLSQPKNVQRYAAQIMAQAVNSKVMPLANETQMSDEEREQLGAWIKAGARLDEASP